MIVTIAAIAEKSAERSQRSYGNTTGTIVTIVAIAAIAITGIELGSLSAIVKFKWKPLSSDRSGRSDRQLSQNAFQTREYKLFNTVVFMEEIIKIRLFIK